MPTDLVTLLAWGIPGIAMAVAGQVVVFVVFFRTRQPSLLGLRLTALGFLLANLGWLAAAAILAFSRGVWPVGILLSATALLVIWGATRVRIAPG